MYCYYSVSHFAFVFFFSSFRLFVLWQKLVREDSPPNIKFFPMDTRRMAWLLAGVVEADVEGLRGGTIPFPAQGGHTDGGFEEQAAPSSEVDKAGFEPESHARVTIRTTLAKNLATRKRAASFLHQLLIMVRALEAVTGRRNGGLLRRVFPFSRKRCSV